MSTFQLLNFLFVLKANWKYIRKRNFTKKLRLRRDIQHNNAQQRDIRHNDTRHNDTQHIGTGFRMLLRSVSFMQNVVYAWCRK